MSKPSAKPIHTEVRHSTLQWEGFNKHARNTIDGVVHLYAIMSFSNLFQTHWQVSGVNIPQKNPASVWITTLKTCIDVQNGSSRSWIGYQLANLSSSASNTSPTHTSYDYISVCLLNVCVFGGKKTQQNTSAGCKDCTCFPRCFAGRVMNINECWGSAFWIFMKHGWSEWAVQKYTHTEYGLETFQFLHWMCSEKAI